ncbi:type I restriction-modification system subunit M N-terminal domain-containing protein [Pseudophaeobacter profundi]|uniref:type I restriction-modification system subunit M N-terminal domain-containing protein n=1 Tax=Pseudophaeobacter profundi TaxID=3034152 RepID=UPI00242D51C4|nr:type I restriction-modification system subunit M N-terminal domain-containing protein [Pseudophaeobacter profundi]
MTPVTQSEINKAAWGACDTFRGVVDPSIYKDYVLTLLFLKYLSDVWQDHLTRYQAEHPDAPELVDAMMQQEAFVLPQGASFSNLHKRRHEPGNGERIDKALHAIEEANITKLRDVFQDISFNSNKLGDEEQKNDILRHLLEDFAKPALDLRPTRVGQLDIIGGAYEYLISRFAATAGKKAGEFYTPAEVSSLMARLVDPQEGDDC